MPEQLNQLKPEKDNDSNKHLEYSAEGFDGLVKRNNHVLEKELALEMQQTAEKLTAIREKLNDLTEAETPSSDESEQSIGLDSEFDAESQDDFVVVSQESENANEEASKTTVSDYEIFSHPAERSFLLEVADNFIKQIRVAENPYDNFVFLDRGARLWGHLIQERWQHLFPEDNIPKTYFVKIGREMGESIPDPDQPFAYRRPWKNIFERGLNDELPSLGDVIDRIKDNIYFRKLTKNLRKSFSRNKKPIFDGKKVLIVDEYMASGGTLSFSKEIFSKAFESADIDAAALVERSTVGSDAPISKNSRSIIQPIPGSHIPSTMGNLVAGVKTPALPSKEYPDKLFIEPIYASPLKEQIELIEKNIELIKQKVEKIPENKRVKIKARDWGEDYIAHPLIDKLNELKDDLKTIQEQYDKVREKNERYRQARQEIHSIAKLD